MLRLYYAIVIAILNTYYEVKTFNKSPMLNNLYHRIFNDVNRIRIKEFIISNIQNAALAFITYESSTFLSNQIKTIISKASSFIFDKNTNEQKIEDSIQSERKIEMQNESFLNQKKEILTKEHTQIEPNTIKIETPDLEISNQTNQEQNIVTNISYDENIKVIEFAKQEMAEESQANQNYNNDKLNPSLSSTIEQKGKNKNINILKKSHQDEIPDWFKLSKKETLDSTSTYFKNILQYFQSPEEFQNKINNLYEIFKTKEKCDFFQEDYNNCINTYSKQTKQAVIDLRDSFFKEISEETENLDIGVTNEDLIVTDNSIVEGYTLKYLEFTP